MCHILGCAAHAPQERGAAAALGFESMRQQFLGVSSLGVAWPRATALTSAPASLGARHHRALPGSGQSAGS